MRMQIDESGGPKKNEAFDSRRFKTRLLVSLAELSRKAQQSDQPHTSSHSASPTILGVEDDGLEYIENIIFDLFNAILLVNSQDCVDSFGSGNTPEALCSAAIASSTSVTFNLQNTPSPKLTKKGQQAPSASVLNNSALDLNEMEQRVRQIFPRGLADAACSKAGNTVNECRKFISSAKKSRLFRNLR